MTTLVVTGVLGLNGWYTSPLTLSLTVTPGSAPVAASYWRVESSDWVADWITYTWPRAITTDGIYTVSFYSVDVNGEREVTHTTVLRRDATPPGSAVNAAALVPYQEDPLFTVSWLGLDNLAGLSGYDVQYRDGLAGLWRPWLTNTVQISATFPFAQRGHVYYFRSRARDLAGNAEPWPGGEGGDAETFVNPVENGGFELGTWNGWQLEGVLQLSLVSAYPYGGQGAWAALLGSPTYDPITPTDRPVPMGEAALVQTITLPSLVDVPSPVLTLHYHIFTYDVVQGSQGDGVITTCTGRLFDSFDVDIYATDGAHLATLDRAGNHRCWPFVPSLREFVGDPVYSLAPFAGRTVRLRLSNWNRQDSYYNTWTYIDDIRVINRPYAYRLALPTILSSSQSASIGPTGWEGQPRNGSR